MNKKDYWCVEDKGKLKTSELIAQMKKTFTVYFYDEENIDKNFPIPLEKTTRYFNKTEESDADLKNKSRNDIGDQPIMTLREYILLFMQYHKETGKYLDEKGWTIFSDRLSSGEVADGYWNPFHREVDFSWDGADHRRAGGGARVAISLDSSSSNPSEMSLDELEGEIKEMQDAAEMLWVVLANVSGGDWSKQSEEWQKGASRWRDNYLKVFHAPKDFINNNKRKIG